MDIDFIKNLLCRGIIGIRDEERKRPQDILINLKLYTDCHQAGQSDKIDDCVNYSIVAKKVQAHAENSSRKTVEALATDIAYLCLEDSRILKAYVRVEKPGAVRFSESVGVEILRQQEEMELKD